METEIFVTAYREINTRLINMMASMSTLRELSGVEVSGVDENVLINESLRILLTNQSLDYVCVYLKNKDKLEFNTRLSWDGGKGTIQHEQITDLDQLADDSFKSQQVKYPSSTEQVQGSAMCIPLQSNDEILGIFCTYSSVENFFEATHERSLLIFCNFFSQLLVNNRLINNMESIVRERTILLEKALQEAEELKKRYAELSVIDDLTQLHNRRFYFPETSSILCRALRYKRPFSILTLDIDRFKDINDQFGHSTGDIVLKDFAELLKSEKRDADIVARFGGEEFVITLPETNHEGALTFAARIKQKAAELSWRINNVKLSITVTIGLACLKDTSEREAPALLDTLLQQADAALYYGKNHGRNQINFFNDIAENS